MTKEVIDLIHARMEACLELAKSGDDAAYCIAEAKCLASAAEHGWNWEADDLLVTFCLKATPVECCIATRAAFDAFLAQTGNGVEFWPPALAFAINAQLPPDSGYIILSAKKGCTRAMVLSNITKQEQLALVKSWMKAQE